MENTPGLTVGYPTDINKMIRQTYAGQAAWAGGGPARKTCGDCQFYGGYMHRGYTDKGEPKMGMRDHHCMKYYELMHKMSAKPVPHTAKACRYFLQSQTVEP